MRCEKHTAQREKRKQLIFIVSGEALQGGDFFLSTYLSPWKSEKFNEDMKREISKIAFTLTWMIRNGGIIYRSISTAKLYTFQHQKKTVVVCRKQHKIKFFQKIQKRHLRET